MSKKQLIVIVGPTAVGKTDLCVALAKHLKTEIISADSRQFYRQMAIGTAKPTIEEMQGIKHHFVDSHDITDEFNAGSFEKNAIQVINQLFLKYDQLILTGGSGLYIKAVTDGMDEFPEIDQSIRENLNNRLKSEGIKSLSQELSELDPEHYARVDKQNAQRVIRALEVCLGSGKPYSSFLKREPKTRPWSNVKIGLAREREELYTRINARVDLMISAGLIDEVKSLIEFRNTNSMQTVGYKEILSSIDGECNFEEAIEAIKQNTRRFAKRQMTWFKKEKFTWFPPDEFDSILKFITD